MLRNCLVFSISPDSSQLSSTPYPVLCRPYSVLHTNFILRPQLLREGVCSTGSTLGGGYYPVISTLQ